jgi:uncharacterized protein YbcV (DUF1398 family)
MNSTIIKECTARSLAGNITFPEVVQKLQAIGTERYTADLIGKCKTYYGPNDQMHSERLDFDGLAIAREFDGGAVKQAVSDIQQGQINYRDFLFRIMDAGCTHYEVFITGMQTIYFGRDGSQHVERFGPKK